MHAYVDLFSFPGMEIDLALREFLSYFRLPGEGQKIDRLMEKFAERFFKDNSGGMYGNADAAYLLAFSIIMLATDLHNPAQKNKMQRSDWKRLLLGQNDGKDYDDLKLDAIYARIAAEELKVRDDDVSGTTPEKPDPQLVVEKQLNMLKDRSALKGNSTVFHKATNVEYAKPMFGVSWHPILAALSVIMEENDVRNILFICAHHNVLNGSR
jgi:brefeldin A-inhibited guanine nucleotide-exchange protein